MHPELIAALAREHRADITRTRSVPDGYVPAARRHLSSLAVSAAGRARSAAGWLLVDAGLRLAVRDRNAIEAR